MNMHSLNLDETTTKTSTPASSAPTSAPVNQPTQPVIDDPLLAGDNQTPGAPLRPLDTKPMAKKSSPRVFMTTVLIAIALGVASGYAGNQLWAGGGELASEPVAQVATGGVKAGDVFGSRDTSTFSDQAEGYLEIGGFDGEGTHALVRPGGPSQTVYLTSSVTDLDQFEGMSVKIWGETFKGQKVGWLMDVGRVEVVETQGSRPE